MYTVNEIAGIILTVTISTGCMLAAYRAMEIETEKSIATLLQSLASLSVFFMGASIMLWPYLSVPLTSKLSSVFFLLSGGLIMTVITMSVAKGIRDDLKTFGRILI